MLAIAKSSLLPLVSLWISFPLNCHAAQLNLITTGPNQCRSSLSIEGNGTNLIRYTVVTRYSEIQTTESNTCRSVVTGGIIADGGPGFGVLELNHSGNSGGTPLGPFVRFNFGDYNFGPPNQICAGSCFGQYSMQYRFGDLILFSISTGAYTNANFSGTGESMFTFNVTVAGTRVEIDNGRIITTPAFFPVFNAVPEPSSILLTSTAIAALAFRFRRR